MDQQNELEDQSDALPFWPIYGTELVFEWTVSEAVMSLAARIPPELFDNILFYVNVDRVSQRNEYNRDHGNRLTRNRGEPSPDDILTDLKRCSLVCLFWANRCREHMFSARTLEVGSYQDAEIFRRYVVEGCPRLTPVHQLIRRINITQNYSRILAPQDSERQTSFLHLLYLPAIQDKVDGLSINGPVPDGFNPAKLDTPHWGVSPSMFVPSSFLTQIFLKNIHFPSFRHVAKYMRHFTCATSIVFETITWDGQTPTYSVPQVSNIIACQRRPRCLSILAIGVCTDSVHLALTAFMLNPNCLLHRLSDEDRVWMTKFMTLLSGDKKNFDVWLEFDVSEQATTMRTGPYYFAFEEALVSTDQPASALSVAGMHAYIYHSEDFPANFDALVHHARTHPAIRALVLLFPSFDILQETMKPSVEVLALATVTIDLVLAYRKEEDGRTAVGVDPVTLELNGRHWADLPHAYGWPKSAEILRRELKKRR